MRLALLLMLLTQSVLHADDWPQFRGLGGRATGAAGVRLPDDLDVEKHLRWKVEMPKGHSSPVVVQGRVFLTAFDGERFETIALSAETGETAWRKTAPHDRVEKVHRVGSRATPTVACDGEHVVAMFGSSGLFCYDVAGELKWHVPMGPFDNSFGAASSPLIVGNRVILVQDHDTGSHLVAVDLASGETAWRVERPAAKRGFSTPAVVETDSGAEIVVAGSGRLTAYNAKDGRPTWFVRGLCRVVSNTPVVAGDGLVYVASNGGGSAPNEPEFAKLVVDRDANANGLLEPKELPGSPIKSFFGQFDADKDGSLNETEYESVRRIFAEAKPSAFAVRPGGEGDVTESRVAWTQPRATPRNASPVLANGALFVVRDGGILVSVDVTDGEIVQQERLPGNGKQFSSPVVADGKLFVADDKGVLSVVSADPEFEVLTSVELDAGVYATPAVAGGALFVRTTKTLYCFRGEK